MRDINLKWETGLPKENGDYIVTVQTIPYSNNGNKVIFAKYDKNKRNNKSYGFTYLNGIEIKDTIVSWTHKPEPYQGYYAP